MVELAEQAKRNAKAAPAGTAKGRAPRAAGETAPPRRVKEPTPYERVKLQVAEELGLSEKVRVVGWAGLTAAETGRIGGLITRRLRQLGFMLGPGGTLLPLQVRTGGT